jgi:hypothetical protein
MTEEAKNFVLILVWATTSHLATLSGTDGNLLFSAIKFLSSPSAFFSPIFFDRKLLFQVRYF